MAFALISCKTPRIHGFLSFLKWHILHFLSLLTGYEILSSDFTALQLSLLICKNGIIIITYLIRIWRRAWQPTPIFLPGESPGTEEPGRLQSMGSQSQTWRVTKHRVLWAENELLHIAYSLLTLWNCLSHSKSSFSAITVIFLITKTKGSVRKHFLIPTKFPRCGTLQSIWLPASWHSPFIKGKQTWLS